MTAPEYPIVDDPLAWCVSEALRECLCTEIEATSAPVGCCCLMPGADVTADSCETGQAWVRLAQLYQLGPQFPAPATGLEPGPCGAGYGWAGVFELGVLRCMPLPDERGNLPSCDEYSAVARLVQADAHAMRRAVLCCDWRTACSAPDNRILVGTWSPLGPDGNCVGGVLTVTMELFGCICDPEPTP